jgi:diguanylate cyclase
MTLLQEEIITSLLAFVAAALHHAQNHEKVTRESLIDELTQLPNRRAYSYQLRMESRRPFVLALLDLDGFKAVNDTKGHEGGNYALRAVSMALRQGIREVDSIYRIGGDEFAIIFTGCDIPSLIQIASIIDRLRTTVESLKLGVSFSVGALQYPPGEDLDLFCDRVDQVLYADKLRRKARRTGKWTL